MFHECCFDKLLSSDHLKRELIWLHTLQAAVGVVAEGEVKVAKMELPQKDFSI